MRKTPVLDRRFFAARMASDSRRLACQPRGRNEVSPNRRRDGCRSSWRRRIMRSAVAVLALAVLCSACQSGATPTAPGITNFAATQVQPNGPCVATALVPLYVYPGPEWQEVRHVQNRNRSVSIAVIVNPSNGPG